MVSGSTELAQHDFNGFPVLGAIAGILNIMQHDLVASASVPDRQLVVNHVSHLYIINTDNDRTLFNTRISACAVAGEAADNQ